MSDQLVYRTAQIVRADNTPAEDRSFDIVASTEDIDTYDSIVESTWLLERFAKNPVVLYGHNRFESMPALPIGTAANVRVENKALRGTITIVGQDEHPFADHILAQIRKKTLRGISVGFNPRTARIQNIDGREILRLSNNELIEISVEPTQSNPNALIELRARARGTMSVKAKQQQRSGEPASKPVAPPMSDYEASSNYIADAVNDVPGMEDPMKGQCRAAILARTQQCRDAGMPVQEDVPEGMRAIFDSLGVESLEEAQGAVAALLVTRNHAAGNAAETERRAILDEAVRAGKITPAQLKDSEYMKSLDKLKTPAALRAFTKALPKAVPIRDVKQPSTPSVKDDTPDIGNKKWSQLTNMERHALVRSDPVRAKALRAAEQQ